MSLTTRRWNTNAWRQSGALVTLKSRLSFLLRRGGSRSESTIRVRGHSSISDRQATVVWPSRDLLERTKRVEDKLCRPNKASPKTYRRSIRSYDSRRRRPTRPPIASRAKAPGAGIWPTVMDSLTTSLYAQPVITIVFLLSCSYTVNSIQP